MNKWLIIASISLGVLIPAFSSATDKVEATERKKLLDTFIQQVSAQNVSTQGGCGTAGNNAPQNTVNNL